jgi:acyl-coenzyme A synthetase/AMP-(fatty) acid ligase
VPLLARGTALVCGSAALPHAMATEIGRFRPTVFPAVPALLRALVAAEVPRAALQTVRTIVSAGAPLAPEIARAFHERFGKRVHNFYGSSETGGITYDRTGTAALTGRSVGTPLDGVRLKFRGDRRVRVTSAAVFTLGNRHVVRDRGSHRPGDFAELNAQGELVLLGRAGRVMKIAGRRLNLAEVEHALRQLAGVRDALAFPHPGRTDAIAAAVAIENAHGDLRTALRERLAAWKIPRKLIELPSFPLTPRGKVDTRKLRELVAS